MADSEVRNRIVGASASAESRARRAVNTLENIIKTTNERILEDIHEIYTEKDSGLTRLGAFLKMDVRVPRRKITVMLIGNHSAGKSSFINWYLEESLLKTGVAIETQGFSFVTSGKRRDTLRGLATLTLYPHLKPFLGINGVMEYLSTEISTSRAKKFHSVTFIDTPGLVDGELHYPFDITETYTWLGEMVDRVYVFFDPMGQALCKRTLDIVEILWAKHSDKIRLYLAKADEAGNEKDRQKVLMQIVQSLCKCSGLNRSGFDMPTIYIPDMLSARSTQSVNQISEVCDDIEKCIEQTVQTSLNNLGSDLKEFTAKVEYVIEEDKKRKSRNFGRRVKSACVSILGMIVPIFAFFTWLFVNSTEDSIKLNLGNYTETISSIMVPLSSIWTKIPNESHLSFVIGVVLLSASCLIIGRCITLEQTLDSKERKYLQNSLKKLTEIQRRKEVMYETYLKQSVGDEEF